MGSNPTPASIYEGDKVNYGLCQHHPDKILSSINTRSRIKQSLENFTPKGALRVGICPWCSLDLLTAMIRACRIRLSKLRKNDKLFKQCYELNNGYDGVMRENLQHNKGNSYVYMLLEKHKVLCWSIKDYDTYSFFTDKEYRHKGMASRLIGYIHKKIKRKVNIFENYGRKNLEKIRHLVRSY